MVMGVFSPLPERVSGRLSLEQLAASAASAARKICCEIFIINQIYKFALAGRELEPNVVAAGDCGPVGNSGGD